jgi:uncharacterized protein YjeT (DUF2065 family)
MTSPREPDHLLRNIGWALLVIGTIVGSLGGARLPTANWPVALLGIAVVAAGAVVLFAVRRRTGSANGARPEVLAAMRALPDRLDALARDAPVLPLAAIAARIGELDRTHFRPIADGAPGLLPALGVTRYADVFGTYASGERSVARAWSAAADHHRPETLAALEAGVARIREAVARLDR